LTKLQETPVISAVYGFKTPGIGFVKSARRLPASAAENLIAKKRCFSVQSALTKRDQR